MPLRIILQRRRFEPHRLPISRLNILEKVRIIVELIMIMSSEAIGTFRLDMLDSLLEQNERIADEQVRHVSG